VANDDHDLLSALIEGIREGFRGPPKKKGQKKARPSFAATLMSVAVIIFVLALVLGLIGAFIGLKSTDMRRTAAEHGSAVVPGFLFGAGLGVLVGFAYAVRAWWRGDEL